MTNSRSHSPFQFFLRRGNFLKIAVLVGGVLLTGFILPTGKMLQSGNTSFSKNSSAVKTGMPADYKGTGSAVDAGFIIDTLATGLSVPWDIVFLPDGKMLFSERPGRVRIYQNDSLLPNPALLVPDIEVKGKMGLLGLCLHPDFSVNHFIYLAYNYREEEKTFLRVARYSFDKDSLLNPVTIIEDIPGVFNHTGSRLAFGPDRKLYISTGDADVPVLAQDLKACNGKILRLNDDGSIPGDNPFVHNDTARKEIWTYGHRNPQGLVFRPGTGKLYDSEHGPTGGDEINLIKKGDNYGWPVTHHRDTASGMRSPLMEFTPSIGPSESLFYSGKAFPALKGHLLVACMRGEAILNVSFSGSRISQYQFLLKKKFGRIRALAEGPDGYLYISTSMVDPPESDLSPADGSFDLLLRMRPDKSHAIPSGSMTTAIFSGGNAVKGRTAPIIYQQLCSGCHGAEMNGREKIPSLVDAVWNEGGTRAAITRSVSAGVTSKGMPAWKGVLTDREIAQMVSYIISKRQK